MDELSANLDIVKTGLTLLTTTSISFKFWSYAFQIAVTLQYVTITRPDISFVVNKACQFMAHPTSTHWLAVKRILRYLKGTSARGLLLYSSSSLALQGYTNVDWASCSDDRKNTSGYCLFLRPNLISQSSSKQKIVSQSNVESKYRSLTFLTAEIVQVQSLLKELCIAQTQPSLVWCDNKSATTLAANPVFHACTKNIELYLHFIQYIPSSEQVADIFKKHIPNAQFFVFRTKLSVVPTPVYLRGDDNHQETQ